MARAIISHFGDPCFQATHIIVIAGSGHHRAPAAGVFFTIAIVSAGLK
jgi:hypothetical protein